MNKFILFSLIFLSLNACYKLPQREEIEYRNRLENALVDTFPKKATIIIHPFENLSKRDTNRAYLEQAIPDHIEAMLEPMRSTLAYIPFDGMPFYVSEELSNLFQVVDVEDGEEANFDEFGVEIEDEEDEDDDEDEDDEEEDNTIDIFGDDEDEEEDRSQDAYFTYLTNYLLVVPTQETQYNAETTTNTNYFRVITNTAFENGVPVTNINSNEILLTVTNAINTNVIIVNKNLLTPTNMLLLLYEEFPELTNYLSFLPIEIRRATEEDQLMYADYKLKLSNPTRWRAEQLRKAQEKAQKEREEAAKTDTTNNTSTTNNDIIIEIPDTPSPYPEEPFEYIYHIGGNYRTRPSDSLIRATETSILLQIFPVYSTGTVWWEQRYDQKPPLLSQILKLDQSFDPDDTDSYKAVSLRTPFNKPPISPRLQDEFETYSTNFRDTRPATHKTNLRMRTTPLNLRINVPENEIPIAMFDWLKYFHATIINRPYTALRITSNPADALVYLNGFYIGTTPLIYPTAPLGQQRIVFLKDGFNREEILTDIIPNRTNSIFYNLQNLNNTGVLGITASIPEAEVYVNALYKGKTPVIISNLTLRTKYRIEVLDPSANLSSNRNSVYSTITLTEDSPSANFDAQFKSYETSYRTPGQKALLAATYLSWFTTIGLLGASIYTQSRAKEAEDLIYQFGTPTTVAQQAQLAQYQNDHARFLVTSQATLYSSIAVAILSTGIMGWYLYSKEVYLGMDINPEKKEWYANFKLKF